MGNCTLASRMNHALPARPGIEFPGVMVRCLCVQARAWMTHHELLCRVVTVLAFSVFFGLRAFNIFVRVFFGLSGLDYYVNEGDLVASIDIDTS